MSQQAVLQLLHELGGTAISSEIIRLAREKYPNLSLWQYVGNRLRKLRKWAMMQSLTSISLSKKNKQKLYLICSLDVLADPN
jgi:hypothetical protein